MVRVAMVQVKRGKKKKECKRTKEAMKKWSKEQSFKDAESCQS
jgi:hypothetical protein